MECVCFQAGGMLRRDRPSGQCILTVLSLRLAKLMGQCLRSGAGDKNSKEHFLQQGSQSVHEGEGLLLFVLLQLIVYSMEQ